MKGNVKMLWGIIQANIAHINTFEQSLDAITHTEYEKYLLSCIEYVTQRAKEIELCWDTIPGVEIVQFSHIVLNVNSLSNIHLTTLSLSENEGDFDNEENN